MASDQRLVAESVAAALRDRLFETDVLAWPDADAIGTTGRRGPRRAGVRPTPAPHAGLLLTDLDRMAQVRVARGLLSSLDMPWLVLTLAPRGPAWGAMYDAGATLVLPSGIGLDATVDLVADLATGWLPDLSRRERKQLVMAWRTFESERAHMAARLKTLSGREEEVLQQLHDGVGVRAIAEQSEVAEATVRSQVKAILRKLDLNSQIAAVLAYEELVTDSVDPDLRHVGDPPGARGAGASLEGHHRNR